MKTIYQGKTKNVLTNGEDYFLLFKDDATGENGVFDPGSNTVGGSVSGKGKIGLKITKYFFELLEDAGIPTHYLGADIDACTMQVRNVVVPPLEFVLRYFAAGSMCRRFEIAPGIAFEPPYTEVTLKSDAQGDPLITERLCIMKCMLLPGEYEKALSLLTRTGEVLREALSKMNLTLLDFKIEIGFDENRNIYIADEITPDIWRVQDENGNIPNQIDCAKIILGKINL